MNRLSVPGFSFLLACIINFSSKSSPDFRLERRGRILQNAACVLYNSCMIFVTFYDRLSGAKACVYKNIAQRVLAFWESATDIC